MYANRSNSQWIEDETWGPPNVINTTAASGSSRAARHGVEVLSALQAIQAAPEPPRGGLNGSEAMRREAQKAKEGRLSARPSDTLLWPRSGTFLCVLHGPMRAPVCPPGPYGCPCDRWRNLSLATRTQGCL